MNTDFQYLVYTKRPFYLSELIRKSNATPVAKLAYERLVDYAIFKNSTKFKYDNTWLATEINVSAKTIARAKEKLIELGFMLESGEIVIPKPEAQEARASKFTNTTTSPRVEQQQVAPVAAQNIAIQTANIQKQENDNSVGLTGIDAANSLRAMLGGYKHKNNDGQNVSLDVTKCPVKVDKMSTLYNSPTITVNQITIQPLPEQVAKTSLAEKPKTENGLFSNSANRGIVGENVLSVKVGGNRKGGVARSIGEMVNQGEKGANIVVNLPYRTNNYIEAALRRMGAHGKDAERYSDEIKFSVTKGNFSHTEPLKAVRACLNLIERGAWRAPAGMY